MNVNRLLVVNSIEPSVLSFRAPFGVDTKLNVQYVNHGGVAYNADLAAQLQLTSRSSARTISYLMPATDIANGRARATIPADELVDTNGYRLRIVGTVNGDAALLATGTVMPIASAGFEAIPEDIIDTVDLTFDYDSPVDIDVTLWADAGKGSPYDMTTTTITAAVYGSKGSTALVPFSVTVLSSNQVKLSLTVGQVNALPAACWWSLVASTAAGATTLCEGNVTIAGAIEPPLPVTTDNWNYVKPAIQAAPATGQIVHASNTANVLLISALSQPGTDRVTLLADLEAGDRITIDAVTWTVRSTAYNPAGYYEVLVTPITQAAVSGVTPVLFEPA